MRRNKSVWPKIEKIKKFIFCKCCGKKVVVKCKHQRFCEECGYRKS